MNKNFIWIILVSLFITLVNPTVFTENIAYAQNIKVTGDTVNIRIGAGLSYPVVTKVKKHDSLSVLKEDGDWLYVKTQSGQEGWIASWLTAKETSTVSKNQSIKILENHLRVRDGAGTTNKILGTVQKGDTYPLIQEKNGWYQIESTFGKGWVSGSYATKVESTPPPNTNIEEPKDTTPSTPNVIATGKVTATTLNVRKSAATTASIVGKLKEGTTVSIISQSESWTQIIFNNTTAWVSSQYIEKANDLSSEIVEGKTVKVTASVLKVRSSHSQTADEVGKVVKDQIFKVLDEKNDWFKVEFKSGTHGWIAGWYTEAVTNVVETPVVTPPTTENSSSETLSILNDGTNIRTEATTSSSVLYRASKNEQFEIIEKTGDWYKIKLSDGSTGFVAGWIVSINGTIPVNNQTATEKYLAGKTIVIDAGHGGRDSGTIGVSGTQEKGYTLTVAKQLKNALEAAGANVVMTRTTDTYVSLANRVYLSSYHKADAYVSVHFDSINDPSIRGLTTYYYHTSHQSLAKTVHSAAVAASGMKSRNARYGNYYVLRENTRPSILMELGYLSNAADEAFIQTSSFQSNVVKGIVTGLTNYFK